MQGHTPAGAYVDETTTQPDTDTKGPNLLDVCKAQAALLQLTEQLARQWRKSGNPARRADGGELLLLLRGGR